MVILYDSFHLQLALRYPAHNAIKIVFQNIMIMNSSRLTYLQERERDRFWAMLLVWWRGFVFKDSRGVHGFVQHDACEAPNELGKFVHLLRAEEQ